jgi:TonB family protein
VEGTMAVRCVVTKQGTVHGCRVLKSLPYMDAAVIRALHQRRYTPALINGQQIEVDYLFQIRLRLPAP